jgi:DNA-binding NtrC family response regulator
MSAMGEPPLARPGRAQKASADLVGTSAAMRALREDIARLAPTDATVLLQGPSGSGKENVARALHAQGPRAAGRFEAVNCGAIPHDLAEAELFGAEAGAYTGATRPRVGRVEAASGGTLFLDEIGDLPLALQVKLLRVLETREVERLGGSRPVPVDIRVVAATNVDLEEAVAEGRFRADLYWRLAVMWLDLPPLHARADDIPALVQHFAEQHRQRLYLTETGIDALAAHSWPGNLRELRNLVERAIALGERCLDAEAVARLLHPRRRPMAQWLAPAADAPARSLRRAAVADPGDAMPPLQLKALLAEAEAAFIAEALEASGGTIARSARLLGLKRTTLVEKMRRMGLRPPANEAA